MANANLTVRLNYTSHIAGNRVERPTSTESLAIGLRGINAVLGIGSPRRSTFPWSLAVADFTLAKIARSMEQIF